jgi:hypothetical protein
MPVLALEKPKMSRLACLAALFAGLSFAAQAQSAAPVKRATVAVPLETAYARAKVALERCWNDELDSRVNGLHHQKAEIPAFSRGGVTLRMAWYRGSGDRPGPLLGRAFDIRLEPDGAGTRLIVLAHIARPEYADDIEAWLKGRERCFVGRPPEPRE